MKPADDKTGLYLEYLEKEMSIMGILSTFCVSVDALVLGRVLSADDKQAILKQLWDGSAAYLIVASVFVLIAALCFYRQRSLLAWFYGQICLTSIRNPAEVLGQLDDADSWETWLSYQAAFGFLFLGFVEYVAAVVALLPGALGVWLRSNSLLCIIVPCTLLVAVLAFRASVLKGYKYEDDPFPVFFKALRNKFR